MYDRLDQSGSDAGNGFFMILMMALVVLVIVLVVRHLSSANNLRSKEDTSINILKQRYAKGEIDKKEFEEKRKDLQS
jgi:putative membrane protein